MLSPLPFPRCPGRRSGNTGNLEFETTDGMDWISQVVIYLFISDVLPRYLLLEFDLKKIMISVNVQ